VEDIATIKLWDDTVDGFQAQGIIIGDAFQSDLDGLFDSNDTLVQFGLDAQWPQVLKALSIFKSGSDARRNGWDKDVDNGWSEARFKKQRKTIFCFKQPRLTKLERLKTRFLLSRFWRRIERGIERWTGK
jgi:hypothetical protein